MDKTFYGLIISDWNMEPMTGLDLLKRVRSHSEHARARFIIMSATGDRSQVLAAKEAGADGYIVKPFTAQTLQAKLESAFGTETVMI